MNDDMQQTKLKFRTTSAVSDADISGYEEFLNQILQDDETHNVAITGTYGSGKSSVLNSYEKKYKLEKEIHRIQIASFGAENLSDDQIELKLEKRIINNLRVAIPNSKLKGTGLYRPENITQKDIESLLSWGLAAVVPQIGIKYLQLSKVESFILGSISLLFIVMMVYTFLQIISKSQILAKVSFDKVSVDMNKSDEKTLDYFDDFMSDVIGAFAKLEVKYVVFEDLDRFENKYIFERLREINLLLNNVTPERIVFIYLIRNDLFTEIEMSKFFDATVPVVPVLDKSNSYSQFLKIAKNEYSLDVKELNVMKVGEIFEFIHDMRLLIAILNDYQLYSFLFSNDLLSKTKLLAMMVYKNVFPIDFSLAQNGQGVLAKVVNLSETIRKDKIEQINYELGEKEDLLEEDDTDDSLARTITNLRQDVQRTTDMSFEELMSSVDADTLMELLGQEEAIPMEGNDGDKLEKKAYGESFKQIYNSEYKGLFYALVTGGLIDEKYNDYISYFVPGELSRTDYGFVRAAISNTPFEFEKTTLKNPVAVAKRVSADRIYNSGVLNTQLLRQSTAIVNSMIRVANKLDNPYFIVKSLVEIKSEKNIVESILRITYDKWPMFWTSIQNTAKVMNSTDRNIDQAMLWLFEYYSGKEDVHFSQKIREYLGQIDIKIISEIKYKRENIIKTYPQNSIKLGYMSNKIDVNVARTLINNKAIKISDETVEGMFLTFGFNKEYKTLGDETLKFLLGREDDFSAALTSDYLLEFIEWVDNKRIVFKESINTIELLSKRVDIDTIYKVVQTADLLGKSENLIESSEALWPILMEFDYVTLNATNVISYYESQRDKEGINFLIDKLNERGVGKWNKLEVNELLSKNRPMIQSWFDHVAKDTSLLDSVAADLLRNSKLYYPGGEKVYPDSWNEYSNDRLSLVICNGVIKLQVDNVSKTLMNRPDIAVEYANQGFGEFLDILHELNEQGDFDIEIKDIAVQLDSKYRTNARAKKTLAIIKDDISMEGLSESLKRWVLNHNPMSTEVVENLKSTDTINPKDYSAYTRILGNLVKDSIKVKIKDEKFAKNMVADVSNDINLRKVIFASNVNAFSFDEVKLILTDFGFTNLVTLFSGKQPLIDVSEYNKMLITELQRNGIVSSYSMDKHKPDKFRVIPKKNIHKLLN